MKLLPSQKDTVYDIISEAEMPLIRFQWDEINSRARGERATILRYSGTDYYYAFETDANIFSSHYAVFCPGEDAYKEQTHPDSWDEQLYQFRQWLGYLNREITTPNKWERLRRELERTNLNFDDDQDKFSAQEFEDLKRKMEVLKNSLGEIAFLPEQVAAINSKLDHLTEMAVTLNKFDWKSLFIGTIVSIVIQLNVTQDNAQALWVLIKSTFNTYFLP